MAIKLGLCSDNIINAPHSLFVNLILKELNMFQIFSYNLISN